MKISATIFVLFVSFSAFSQFPDVSFDHRTSQQEIKKPVQIDHCKEAKLEQWRLMDKYFWDCAQEKDPVYCMWWHVKKNAGLLK